MLLRNPVGKSPIRCRRFGGYRGARRCPPGLSLERLGRKRGLPPRGAPWEVASPSGLLGAPSKKEEAEEEEEEEEEEEDEEEEEAEEEAEEEEEENKKSRAESRFERSVTMPLAFFFSLISGPKSVENRSKYVSR